MTRALARTLLALAATIVIATVAVSQMHEGHAHKGPAPVPQSIAIPAGGVTLPMLDIGGRPVVEAMISGKGPFRMILDTGAHVSVVDSALRAELSLPLAAGVRAAPMGGAAPQILMIPELRLGKATLRGVIAAVMPIGSLFERKIAPRGVLSASSFPGYLVTFDYPRKRITIVKGELGPADSATTFEYLEEDELPTIPVRVAGHQARVHLDTGSGYGLTLPNHWLDELPLASEPWAAGLMKTHSGEFPLRKARIDGTLSIGALSLDSTTVMFSDVRPGPSEPTGNIGYEALKKFAVTLDAKNRRIRLTP